MKNKGKKSNITSNNWLFKSTNWDWLLIHSCVLIIFGQEAFKHKSLVGFVLIILFAMVFVVHDLSIVYKRGLYADFPNSKYLKSYMPYMAIELLFTLILWIFGKIWEAPILLLTFFAWMFVIIPRAIKILNATFYIIKRWSRVWTRII